MEAERFTATITWQNTVTKEYYTTEGVVFVREGQTVEGMLENVYPGAVKYEVHTK